MADFRNDVSQKKKEKKRMKIIMKTYVNIKLMEKIIKTSEKWEFCENSKIIWKILNSVESVDHDKGIEYFSCSSKVLPKRYFSMKRKFNLECCRLEWLEYMNRPDALPDIVWSFIYFLEFLSFKKDT